MLEDDAGARFQPSTIGSSRRPYGTAAVVFTLSITERNAAGYDIAHGTAHVVTEINFIIPVIMEITMNTSGLTTAFDRA